MYTLSFNGYFELEYPNEFLAELAELQKKHNCDFYGQPILHDLGHYVDFQKVEVSDVQSNDESEDTSELKEENKNEEV